MGLLAGSITLSGGHGTGAAWSKLFVERYGFEKRDGSGDGLCHLWPGAGCFDWLTVARYLVKHSTTPDGRPDDRLVPTAALKTDF